MTEQMKANDLIEKFGKEQASKVVDEIVEAYRATVFVTEDEYSWSRKEFFMYYKNVKTIINTKAL